MSATRILSILLLGLVLAVDGGTAQAGDLPDEVRLDDLVELFEGVDFDHAMHAELGEDCSVCHHHTTGTGTVDERCVRCHADSDEVSEVGCRNCHVADPFSAENINREAEDRYQFHIDKPGLKAAFHWNCVSCHREMDGPTECQDCHARTPEGDAFYHAGLTVGETAPRNGH